jgi:hypothetical protein
MQSTEHAMQSLYPNAIRWKCSKMTAHNYHFPSAYQPPYVPYSAPTQLFGKNAQTVPTVASMEQTVIKK